MLPTRKQKSSCSGRETPWVARSGARVSALCSGVGLKGREYRNRPRRNQERGANRTAGGRMAACMATRVLVIDDSEMLLNLTVNALKEAGFDASGAVDL